MAIKKNRKLRLIIFVVTAAVLIIALATFIYLMAFKTDKKDSADQQNLENLTEEIPGESINEDSDETQSEALDENAQDDESTDAEAIAIDPAEAMASAAYKEGIVERATQFKDSCASIYSDVNDDLARFSLVDIDNDGILDLIMHDVPGKQAYYCSYIGEGISEPFEIFADENSDDSYVPGAYAALYFEKNLFIKYVISGNYDSIESYLYRVNEETKAPELINSVVAKKDGDGSYSYLNSDGAAISKEEYCTVFESALGDDYGHYFLDELMIADGEYDFKAQYVFNSTAAVSHMTLEELTNYITQN